MSIITTLKQNNLMIDSLKLLNVLPDEAGPGDNHLVTPEKSSVQTEEQN